MAAPTAPRTLASSVTSVATNRARSPSSSATRRPRSRSTSATTTDPPWSTTIRAVAAPSPDPPPVTSTVLPAISTARGPQPEPSSQLGWLPRFHLRLQPMLGRCGSGTGWPSRTRSRASRSSAPVTGWPLRGVLSSKAPR